MKGSRIWMSCSDEGMKGGLHRKGAVVSSRKWAVLGLGIFGTLLGLSLAAAGRGGFWAAWLLDPLCHQDPSRCFWVAGSAMPLCVRCVAIYLGLSLGCGGHMIRGWRVADARWVLVAALLSGLDVLLESLGVYQNLFASRMLTGLALGLSVSAYVLARISSWGRASCSRETR